jgi:pimeloyl-ACP methyl ester carboxylesterase
LSTAKNFWIDNHDLYVEEHGPQDGSPVVFLHHGLGSVNAWKAQLEALSQAGWRAIAYDRWGYGRSAPRQEYTIPYFEDDIEDLEALLDVLNIKRAALVGHSDGGTIGLYFAACRPLRVACLVTVAAHIYVEPKMEPGIESVRQAYEHDPRFHQALQNLHGDKTETVFNAWFNGWHREENLTWDMREALSQITCPVLVVQGTEDEHATPQHARDLAAAIPADDQHAGAQLWLVEGGRHMLPQEQPQVFNARLMEFLKQGFPHVQ